MLGKPTKKKNKKQIFIYLILVVISLVLYLFFDTVKIDIVQPYKYEISKIVASLFLIFIVLLGNALMSSAIRSKEHSEGDEYNLFRINKLLTLIAIFIIALAYIFQNLYATVVSFGLASLILGFALQAPITSFIGWLYIVWRKPYQVGNRIQLGVHRGDVIEITYLETIILECNGDYLENDRLSGRVIHFPNSIVLKEEITNYSNHRSKFIWNETAIQVAYTSDLDFVEQCLLEACDNDFGNRFPHLKDIEHWKAAVYFNSNQYAWMEVVIQYPVEPTDTTGRRNRILRGALPMLNAHPEKVQFPEGTRR